MHRRALLVAAIAAGAILAFGIGAATLDDALADASFSPTGGDGPLEGESGGDPPAEAGGAPTSCSSCGTALGVTLAVAGLLPAIPASASLALAAVGLVVLAVLWYRAGGGTAGAAVGRDGRENGVTTAAEGGGIPGGSIEEPPVDNAVYRAWWALAARIDERDPATTTPGEYAAAARERGLPAGAVATVTGLFDRVRYGDAPVTDERAESAQAAADQLTEES